MACDLKMLEQVH